MEVKYKKYQGRESDFQKAVASYLDFLGVLWFHCPNGGTRNAREAVSLKRQGVKAGFPDVCVMEPSKNFHGLVIELKVGRNKTSTDQKKWLAKLASKGYKTAVSYSLDEVKDIVNKYLKNE